MQGGLIDAAIHLHTVVLEKTNKNLGNALGSEAFPGRKMTQVDANSHAPNSLLNTKQKYNFRKFRLNWSYVASKINRH